MISPSRPEVLWTLLLVAAVTVVAAWLRFHNLALESIWFDEAASWFQAKDGIYNLLVRTAKDNYPPLHNFLLYVSMKLFGDGEWSLRLPSAILGTATIPLVYWLGTMTVGRTAGLLAAVFLAFSGYHIDYSQEARMYVLLAFTATLFAAASFFFLRSPNIARGAFLCLSGIALLYTHPYGALNWLAIVIGFGSCLLLRKSAEWRTIKIYAVSNALAAIAFAPWAWVMLGRAARLHERGFWVPEPTADYVVQELQFVAGGPSLAMLLAVGAILAVLPGREGQSSVRQTEPCSPVPILILWAVLPLILGLIVSLVTTPIILHRYLIGALPPMCLAASYGLTRFARGWRGLAVILAASFAVLFAVFANHTRAEKHDWRGIAALLESQLQPSDCVLIYKPYLDTALHYYYRKPIDCEVLPRRVKKIDVDGIEGRRVFALIGHTNDSKKKAISTLFESAGWQPKTPLDFKGIEVRLYEAPE